MFGIHYFPGGVVGLESVGTLSGFRVFHAKGTVCAKLWQQNNIWEISGWADSTQDVGEFYELMLDKRQRKDYSGYFQGMSAFRLTLWLIKSHKEDLRKERI